MARQSTLAKEKEKAKGRGGAHNQQGPLRDVRRARAQEGATATPPSAAELDRLIHERMRLAIVSALAVNESLTFNDLKELLKTTDGNLSVHARKLEEAEYITCNKFFDGRIPKTEYRLTTAGRTALERYLDHMEALIRATRER